MIDINTAPISCSDVKQSNHELLLPLVEEECVCLPLPINVVSRYWNVDIPMSIPIENSKQYPDFVGGILIEGIELAEKYGLACRTVHSDLPTLKRIIDAGIPPTVILPGIPEITQHASVISGYDENENTILHYIQKGTQGGQQQEGAIPQDIFDREWSEDGRLMIILSPPNVMSSVDLPNESDKASRLCLISERQNIQKNYTAALDSLKKALEINPANPTALQMFGALLNEHNSSRCVEFYEKCIHLNKRHYLAYNGLGNYHLKSNQFEKAELFYTKAIEVNPKRSAKIYKNRAYTREKQHKNSQAKDDLKSYLKLAPRAQDRGIIEQAIREL